LSSILLHSFPTLRSSDLPQRRHLLSVLLSLFLLTIFLHPPLQISHFQSCYLLHSWSHFEWLEGQSPRHTLVWLFRRGIRSWFQCLNKHPPRSHLLLVEHNQRLQSIVFLFVRY